MFRMAATSSSGATKIRAVSMPIDGITVITSAVFIVTPVIAAGGIPIVYGFCLSNLLSL